MPNNMPDMVRIVNTYGNDILRLGCLYLKDKHMAEDVLQDTLVKIYRKYHTLNKLTSEKTWIMSIAINVCKNYRRTAWFKKVILMDKIDDIFYNSVEDSTSKFEREEYELLKDIMSLKPIYKEVILLYYYQQFKASEIATILKIKESTVTVRLSRAKEKLKKNLERWSNNNEKT
ncbi:sigma-70 family RNA polymerase sigma factor [Desulfolucanica intricata]|uniref:sigma-70 family RNA polymerase sigma factor n=1 Tax=Desulfolucanica intricata TaxID=1285191 RepID=UPI000B146C64|nr:sigma-70 family RNA polymerase sigma factor [Desulfolucanica intricata]